MNISNTVHLFLSEHCKCLPDNSRDADPGYQLSRHFGEMMNSIAQYPHRLMKLLTRFFETIRIGTQ